MLCYVDVIDSVDTKHLADFAVSTYGAIDVLFNNAGTAIQGKVDVLSEEDWDKTFSVNVKSMFLCSKFVIPVMRARGGGVIINQASESGLIGFPMHPAYCASKAAVINLTRSMAIGHAHENIRRPCARKYPSELYLSRNDSYAALSRIYSQSAEQRGGRKDDRAISSPRIRK